MIVWVAGRVFAGQSELSLKAIIVPVYGPMFADWDVNGKLFINFSARLDQFIDDSVSFIEDLEIAFWGRLIV